MTDTAREVAGEARRREIVGAALELFAERGYKGASLAHIAGRVGITQQAVLYHFGSKEQLLVDVLEERDRQDRDWWSQTLGADGAGLDFLDMCQLLVEHTMERPHRARLLTTLAGDSTTEAHPAHAFFQDRYARLREHLAPALADAHERLGRPGPSVAVVLAVLDGLQLQWLLEPETFDMAAEFRSFVRSIRG